MSKELKVVVSPETKQFLSAVITSIVATALIELIRVLKRQGGQSGVASSR